MSRAARDWAWGCRGLTPASRCILLALAEHADEEGRCWPSLSRLAELTEVDRRTVTRGLAELEARGLIGRERGRGARTLYRLAVGGPTRGVTPLGEGCETPGDGKALGASDPPSRGVRPLSRGVTPPVPGASDPCPLNRQLNRQGTVVGGGRGKTPGKSPGQPGGAYPRRLATGGAGLCLGRETGDGPGLGGAAGRRVRRLLVRPRRGPQELGCHLHESTARSVRTPVTRNRQWSESAT